MNPRNTMPLDGQGLPGISVYSVGIQVNTLRLFRDSVRSSDCGDVLNKPAETEQAVSGLLPERMRKSPEISGKRGRQPIEVNEISDLVKTLNQ